MRAPQPQFHQRRWRLSLVYSGLLEEPLALMKCRIAGSYRFIVEGLPAKAALATGSSLTTPADGFGSAIEPRN